MIFIKKNWIYILVGVFIGFGVFVRFQGLGYSEFQGDETNPLRYLGDIKGTTPPLSEFLPFLLSQKRGPGQYVINYLNTYIFGYHNEFQIRFPFFIFSILAFISFYKLARKVFNTDTALFTAMFLSLNGLYIAFARITQYQTFMYFIIPLAVYIYLNAVENRNLKKIALSGFLLSLGLLGHYDTLSVGAFFAFYLFAILYRNPKDFKFVLNSSLIFLVFFIIPAVLFYVPFLKGSYYEQSTSGYLTGRLFGSGFMPRTTWSELGRLISLYMPLEAWLLFITATMGGITSLIFDVGSFKLYKFKISKNIMQLFYLLANVFFVLVVIYSHFTDKPVFFPVKPRLSTLLAYILAATIVGIVFISKKIKPEKVGLVAWFLISFCVYFFFIKDPRTHIYITFIPAFILSGYAFFTTVNLKQKYIKIPTLIVMFLYFIYLCGFYWSIYVNKNPEYPWWDKNYIGRELYRVHKVRYKKVDGVFGFNNKRHWEDIRELYDNGCLIGSYNSNEKNSITTFYIGKDQTNGAEEDDLHIDATNLIVVHGPHSWYYKDVDKILLENPHYKLIKTFYNKDYPVSYVLGLSDEYPNGMLCDLR